MSEAMIFKSCPGINETLYVSGKLRTPLGDLGDRLDRVFDRTLRRHFFSIVMWALRNILYCQQCVFFLSLPGWLFPAGEGTVARLDSIAT